MGYTFFQSNKWIVYIIISCLFTISIFLFQSKHSGRKLQWHHHMSNGTITLSNTMVRFVYIFAKKSAVCLQFFSFSGQIWFRRYNISNGCVVLLGKPSIWQSDFRKFAFSYRIAWDWIKKNSMEFSSISKIKKVNFNSCNTM